MKKIILASLFSLMMLSSFAEISLPKLSKKIKKAGCFVIAETQNAGTADKYPVKIIYETNEEFVNFAKNFYHSEIFEDKNEITIERLKYEFKKGSDIFGASYSLLYYNFRWIECKYFPVSIVYIQQKGSHIIYGAGTYVFRIFHKNGVYTISLKDTSDVLIRNRDFDALSDFFSFREEQKLDTGKGHEQTAGYICKSNDSAKNFFQALQAEDPSLPESVLRFQRAANMLEQIISQL